MKRFLALLVFLAPSVILAQGIEELLDSELIGQESSPLGETERFVSLLFNNGTYQSVEYQVDGIYAVVGGDIIIGTHNSIQEQTAVHAIALLRSVNGSTTKDTSIDTAISEVERLFGDPEVEGSLQIHTRPWPSSRIPYRFDGVHPSLEKKIKDAIEIWNRLTNVNIVPANDDERYVLEFRDHPKPNGQWGCAARLGYIARSGGFVLLNPTCTFGAVLHEVGHALGIMHEHSRPERGQYLVVADFARNSNYDINQTTGAATKYDICSLMHYSPRQSPTGTAWFSLTQEGEEAFRKCSKELPSKCRKVGQRCQPSKSDIAFINHYYSK